MASSKHPAMNGVVLTAAEATHYDAAWAAELAYSVADRSTQAKETTASITKHRAIVTAANASGLGYLGGPSRVALHELTGVFV